MVFDVLIFSVNRTKNLKAPLADDFSAKLMLTMATIIEPIGNL